MSNFSNLNHYIIPSSLLLQIIDTYKEIGKCEEYINKVDSYLENQVLLDDAYYLSLLINSNISDQRRKSLIYKKLNPHNKEEEAISSIFDVLTTIKKEALSFELNAGELIGYVKQITKEKIEYSQTMLPRVINKQVIKRTVRYYINEVFDEYVLYKNNKSYENIILLVILYLEITNLQPFNKHNVLASLITLYYYLSSKEIICFKWVSFFKLLYEHYDEFKKAEKIASINYNDGLLQPTNLYSCVFSLIKKAHDLLFKTLKTLNYQNMGFKTDNVESSIYKLPQFFTKDDVRNLNPGVSESTINRVLNKLRSENIIMPLGTGRSARWRKNVENVDISKIVGE